MDTNVTAMPSPELLQIVDLLAEFGALLLSERKQATDSEDFGENTESVEEDTHSNYEGALLFYHFRKLDVSKE